MDRYAQEAADWQRERQAYLEKVRAGRSVRAVDPEQPAFSAEAEVVRQGRALGVPGVVRDRRRAMVEALVQSGGLTQLGSPGIGWVGGR